MDVAWHVVNMLNVINDSNDDDDRRLPIITVVHRFPHY